MIQNYYSLREQPFGATPDPRYLFESETHREALASLRYGIEAGRGFFALIAKPGMGKTTLLFCALNQLKGKAKTVFLFQTICTPLDFLRALLADLGIRHSDGGIVELQAELNDILQELSRRGERLVVVIDEAQKLDDPVLELIRMLSNFETSHEKLMQIVLSGQPELARKLSSPNLVQLRQRVSIVARLQPFCLEETADYIEHRLRVAGWNSENRIFDPEAVRLIAEHSGGIPRNINNLCFNSLSLGCALKRKSVGCEIVREVIADLDLDPLTENRIVVTESKPRLSIEEIPVSKHKNIAWVPKAMVATLLMLVLSGMSTESREVRGPLVHALQQPSKRAQPPLEVSSNSTRQMSGTLSRSRSLPPPAEAGTRNKTKTDSSAGVIDPPESVDWVSVPPGATLSQICAKVLATCRSMDIKTILHLNPWITNPDHLVSGKQLRIPIQEKISSAAGQLPVTSYANKVPMEAAAQ